MAEPRRPPHAPPAPQLLLPYRQASVGPISHSVHELRRTFPVSHDEDRVVHLAACDSKRSTAIVSVGAMNRTLDFAGTDMVLMCEEGSDATAIDCEELSRSLSFQSGEGPSSRLSGFTFTNGQGFYGGAVYCVGSSPTIANCVFEGNSASVTGGAMLIVANSSPVAINCVFDGNSAHDLSGSGSVRLLVCERRLQRCALQVQELGRLEA